jgi:putative DNA primase/helicase
VAATGGAAMTGQPLISIDNVNGELFGDALCQIIERTRPQIRILGKTELVSVESRGTTMFANGNNIVIVGDLCRRVISARLDPKMEKPELREFKGNPVATVLENRGAYVAAALTICRAYIVAGRPNPARRLASFEGWSDTVRSALIWLKKEDPVKSMEDTRAEDPEVSELGDLLSSWSTTIGIGDQYRITLKNVIATIGEMKSDGKEGYPR